MGGIRGYLLSIVAAAALCGILKNFAEEKSAAGGMLKLAAGVFLSFVLVRPLAQFRLSDLPVISYEYTKDAGSAVSEGEEMAAQALRESIKLRTEAYILDKAQSLQTSITAEVTLSDDALPVPVQVRLTGTVSPYAKVRLVALLEEELGIPKEDQIWIE